MEQNANSNDIEQVETKNKDVNVDRIKSQMNINDLSNPVDDINRIKKTQDSKNNKNSNVEKNKINETDRTNSVVSSSTTGLETHSPDNTVSRNVTPVPVKPVLNREISSNSSEFANPVLIAQPMYPNQQMEPPFAPQMPLAPQRSVQTTPYAPVLQGQPQVPALYPEQVYSRMNPMIPQFQPIVPNKFVQDNQTALNIYSLAQQQLLQQQQQRINMGANVSINQGAVPMWPNSTVYAATPERKLSNNEMVQLESEHESFNPSMGSPKTLSNSSGGKGITNNNNNNNNNMSEEEDGDEVDDENNVSRRKPSRKLISSKRAVQNRNAQKAFRQRKEKYVRLLEDKARRYDELMRENEVLKNEIVNLQSCIYQLERRLQVFSEYYNAPNMRPPPTN